MLKGPNAAALYGSRAANGVVVITTKKGGDDRTVDDADLASIHVGPAVDPAGLPEPLRPGLRRRFQYVDGEGGGVRTATTRASARGSTAA